LRRELKRCKKCLTFSGMNVTMEASCGGVSRRIRMDVLDRDLFDAKPNTPENTSWTMKLLEQIDAVTGPGGLDSPIIATGGHVPVPPVPESATLQALKSGIFDPMFGADAGIPQIIRESEEPPPPSPSVELINVTPFMPIAPEMPHYPAIANAARQEGKVNFTFDVDSDGKVGNVVIISGNKLLEMSVVETVSGWKFPPEANGHSGQGTLEFKLNCHSSVRFSNS
jgi:TonB family protein